MKARTESNPETIYDNESYENFSSPSAPLKSAAINGESIREEESGNVNKRLNSFSKNDAVSRKLSPTRDKYPVISDDFTVKKELQPLYFNTREALEETPPILKSLNSGSRGPETFVYISSPKPTSLAHDDDPCKTFVITSDNFDSVNRKNSINQMSAGNGIEYKMNPDDGNANEYLSYVIEKSVGSERTKMNELPDCRNSANGGKQAHLQGSDEVDKATDLTECEKVGSKSVEEVSRPSHAESEKKLNGSEICDIKVQSFGEKTGEDTLSFDRTITGKKEQAFAKLQDELEKAHQELKLKDEEVTRLTRIREDVERELEELTASLFQEAHKMVSKAKEKQAAAEKSLKESQMKVEVLTAEVVALKTLVLTSTPSRPNPHLHPQIGKEENAGGVNLFTRKHRRSPSHYNLKYGRENSPPESPIRDDQSTVHSSVSSALDNRDASEVDPTVHKEFLNWTLSCKLDKTDPFIDRIYREDINLCLDFSNRELAEEVQKAIETRNIYVEAVTDKSKTVFPRKCALLEVTRQCHYRMKLGDQDTWYNISQMCRNRIIAVCDFINYLRYIELGLVKSSTHDMYWEIMRLRKEMVLARLGLALPPS